MNRDPKKTLSTLVVLLALGSLRAQDLNNSNRCPYFVRTVPVVLLNDGSNSVKMEVSAGPGATGVVWQPLTGTPFKVAGQALCNSPQLSFTLHDDGQGGDLKAGDGIFTLDSIQFDQTATRCLNAGSLAEPAGAMSGWREYVTGTIAIKTATGETDLSIANGYYVTLPVIEAQMYRTFDAITPIDANTQQTPWLINIRDDNFQIERAMNNLAPPVASLSSAISSLSPSLPDNYDFRAYVSTTTTACDVGRTQGIHLPLQSSVTGTGQAVVNNSKIYGTGPKLLGFTMLANFVPGSSGLFYHETMHQWGAYLNTQLGVSDGAHWLQNSSVAGALGGCPWVNNGDGTFSIGSLLPTDGDLELYVAGLLPASQVSPLYVASGTVQACNKGQLLKAPYKQVTINDIIALHGPRVPAWDGSVKNYKHAIIVTSQNRLLSPLEMTYYGRLAQMWEGSTIELGPNPPFQWPKYTRGASTFNMLLDSWTGPVVRAANITNSASGQVGAVSPGEIITLYGSRLGPAALAGLTLSSGRVSTNSGGTQVLFDGVPAPMVYSSSGQIAAIVPYEVAGRVAVSVQVSYQGQVSPVVSVPVAAAAPGIYTQNSSGTGAGSILNQDYSLNTAANPAAAGSIIQIFGTGEGQSVPGGVDGGITPGLGSTEQAPSVSIGGVPSFVQFAGPAPQAVAGLFQVNAVVPSGLGNGAVPIQVKFGAASSQAGVTVFVK